MDDQDQSEQQFEQISSQTAVILKSPPTQPQCDARIVSERATLLCGCYRKDEATDAQVYGQAVQMVLSDYPASVVFRVTDPRLGISAKIKWLPSIAEIKEACEAEMKPLRDAEDRERRRAARDAEWPAEFEEPRAKRKTFAELSAMYPDIIGTKAKRPPTEEEKAAALAGLESRREYLRSPIAPSERIRKSLERL